MIRLATDRGLCRTDDHCPAAPDGPVANGTEDVLNHPR